jgi:hypothetical protein
MFTFKDSTDHEWTIALPFGEVLRIKEESKLKFDLLDPTAGELSKRLDDDLLLFWELLHHVIEPQAKARNISAAEFGQRMAGRCLIDAHREFFKAWADFFHQIQRPDLATALETILRLNELTVAKITERLAADPTIAAIPERATLKIDAVLTTALSDFQASCDSILNPTPGDSSGSATKELSAKPARSLSRKRT